MRNTKVNEERNVGAVEEKYALLKKELIKIGGCVAGNRFLRDKNGRPVETPEDYFVWLYDVFLQLSMLELSCTGCKVVKEQVSMIRDIAEEAGHESIMDVVQGLYGGESRSFCWNDVFEAQAHSVRRMVATIKKDMRSQAENFCHAFATAIAVNGGNAFEILKESTALSLAACAEADGEVTPEEEDKLSGCFIITLINDIARQLANFSQNKKS